MTQTTGNAATAGASPLQAGSQSGALNAPNAPNAPDASNASDASIGGALRQLRLSRGWSLDEVAARIKFSTRQIHALEDEQWDSLPTGVSLRGLIRNYARLLGADPDSIVATLDPQRRGAEPPRLVQGALSPRGAGAPVEEAPTSSSWGWLLTILAVIIVAVVYAFWQGWLPQAWVPGWLMRPGV